MNKSGQLGTVLSGALARVPDPALAHSLSSALGVMVAVALVALVVVVVGGASAGAHAGASAAGVAGAGGGRAPSPVADVPGLGDMRPAQALPATVTELGPAAGICPRCDGHAAVPHPPPPTSWQRPKTTCHGWPVASGRASVLKVARGCGMWGRGR